MQRRRRTPFGDSEWLTETPQLWLGASHGAMGMQPLYKLTCQDGVRSVCERAS